MFKIRRISLKLHKSELNWSLNLCVCYLLSLKSNGFLLQELKQGPREISFFALLSKPICFCYWSVLFTLKSRETKFYGSTHCFIYDSNLTKCSKDATRNSALEGNSGLQNPTIYNSHHSYIRTNFPYSGADFCFRKNILISIWKIIANKITFLQRYVCVLFPPYPALWISSLKTLFFLLFRIHLYLS